MKYNPTTEGDFLAAGSFNHRKVLDLNPSQQKLIRAAFPSCKEDDMIVSGICDRFSKPDIYLQIGEEKHYVSLKSGQSTTVHVEKLKPFVLFLRELGLSVSAQKTLLRFHYGDGTMDGTGEVRLGVEELYPRMMKEIAALNEELNQRKFVLAALDRCLFQGGPSHDIEAEFIAYGDPSYFIFASKKELIDSVLWSRYRNFHVPHIGPIVLRPFARDIQRKSKQPDKRHAVSCGWPNLLSDIQRIEARKGRSYRRKRIGIQQGINELDPSKAGDDVDRP